jgi:HSP90 family molecular chaperone
MRNEMIGAVVRRAMEHPEFRRLLIENAHDALQAHGFALEEPEMAEIEQIRTRLGGDDVEKELVTMAEQYGVTPPR